LLRLLAVFSFLGRPFQLFLQGLQVFLGHLFFTLRGIAVIRLLLRL
jgi:hypothetical protein